VGRYIWYSENMDKTKMTFGSSVTEMKISAEVVDILFGSNVSFTLIRRNCSLN